MTFGTFKEYYNHHDNQENMYFQKAEVRPKPSAFAAFDDYYWGTQSCRHWAPLKQFCSIQSLTSYMSRGSCSRGVVAS